MDKLKKARGSVRRSFTWTANEITDNLDGEAPDLSACGDKLAKLQRLLPELRELDQKILDGLLDENCTDDEYDAERVAIDGYEDRYVKVKRLLAEKTQPPRSSSPTPSEASDFTTSGMKRTFKLPKVELKKFNGKLVEWLGFWSQFEKIHEDEELHDSDKFQYLVQSMEPGTRARELVESYPQSSENYPKAVEALKERFGKTELLIEVYVRELLQLVISNVNNRNDKMPVSKMYDKLEAHLRALESMGLESDKNAAWLYPMVESSLPEEVLRAWQRSSLSTLDGSRQDPPKTRLSYLMEFLKKEVESEERISLAKSGFGTATKGKKSDKVKVHSNTDEDLPTAAGLFSGEKVNCLFCDKSHESRECFKAQSMSLAEKKSRIQEKKACYICLKGGHGSKKCKVAIKCHYCSKRHLVLLCPDIPSNKEKSFSEESQVQSGVANQMCMKEVILETVVVKVFGAGKIKYVRVLMDNGSQKSYILEKTAKDLAIVPSAKQSITHALFGGLQTEKTHLRYNIQVENVSSGHKVNFSVLDDKKICCGIPRVPKGPWMEELKKHKIHLSDLDRRASPEIEILIGSDYYGKLLTGRVLQLESGLTAVETILGWTVSGQFSQGMSNTTSMAMLVTSMTAYDTSVQELWRLETIGITDPVESKQKTDLDDEARRHFLNTVGRLNDGRYCVSLPWINGHQPIPCNRNIAEARLVSSTRKLCAQGHYKDYDDVFNEWIAEGVIEKVEDDKRESGCHYLPHRPVFKPQSLTTKVRPVFDASCKTNRYPSLNECLQKGPNLLEQIPAILLRFREKKIGVTADIRRAFLQIEMKDEDTDYLRFLWWEDFKNKKIQVFRHKRVVFGLNCSPYLLGAVIEYHLSQVAENVKPVAGKLLKSLYIDNCCTSVEDEEELRNFKQKTVSIMADAKMDLRMWEYNLPDVSGVGSHSECGLDGKTCIQENSTLVLGIKWNKAEDTLSADYKLLPPEEVITKRKILSATQRIFDPIGYLCPVLLRPKLMLQEAWSSNTDWDEKLSGEINENFRKWYAELHILCKIKIPRRVTFGDRRGWTLHTFCDASQDAYAAVVFVRCHTETGVKVRFIGAKSRVAPIKKPTIPRLELLACSIGSRLANSVVEALEISEIPKYFWTDSTTALAWVKKNDEWGTFVGNRVREICLLTRPEDWYHVPGCENPADLPSRGCSPLQLLESAWWEGPAWLRKESTEWPTETFTYDEEKIYSEKKKRVTNCLAIDAASTETPWYLTIRKGLFRRYSCIIRVCAWMKRFINNSNKRKSKIKGVLSVKELSAAEETILKTIQNEAFSENEGKIAGLSVTRNQSGLICVKTKIVMRDDTTEFRYPVLLPTKHPIVEELIREQHIMNSHAGVQFLASHLREKYWILRSRQAIRSVITKCVRCQRYAAKAVVTDPAPLPKDRVRDAAVFEVVGVDLAGPLYLKEKTKVWIVLYTCAVYRAVHLELVTSLSTEAFLQSLRRFIARRGRPSVIYSDNGTNFVGSNNALRDLNWKKVVADSTIKQIEWRLSVPTAPWWGGWWERLIRSVKGLLVRILGKASLNYEELSTACCDVEAVVNGRPLTFISEEPGDFVPITPAMFLHEIKEAGVLDLDTLDATNLDKRLQYRQSIRESLRSRFRNEYLSQLVQRSTEKGKKAELKVGDVVLVGADNKKRLEWPMAKIEELIPGRDGCIRVARVKTCNGILTRPVQRLYPLEISSEDLLVKKSEKVVREPEMRTRSGRVVKIPSRLGID